MGLTVIKSLSSVTSTCIVLDLFQIFNQKSFLYIAQYDQSHGETCFWMIWVYGHQSDKGPIVEGDQTKPLDRYQADRYRLYVTLGMFLYPLAMEQCTANILWDFETLWRQRQSALNYILETQGVQRNQIWHFLQNFPLELFHQIFPPIFSTKHFP